MIQMLYCFINRPSDSRLCNLIATPLFFRTVKNWNQISDQLSNYHKPTALISNRYHKEKGNDDCLVGAYHVVESCKLQI